MVNNLLKRKASLSLSSIEEDLVYLYEQALTEKNLSLALKIKEFQLRLLIFSQKESLSQTENLQLENLSNTCLKGLISQASLLLKEKACYTDT